MGMDFEAQPIELDAVEAPRRNKKVLAGISASVLAVSIGLFFVPNEASKSSSVQVGASSTTEIHPIKGNNHPNLTVEQAANKKAAQELIAQADAKAKAVQVANALKWINIVYFHTANPTSTDVPMNDQEFLACTRSHESNNAGGYQARSPDGIYYGAYQFKISTWNNTAAHFGRLDLVGVNPALVSPLDQDSLALDLYHWQGNAPWGGRC